MLHSSNRGALDAVLAHSSSLPSQLPAEAMFHRSPMQKFNGESQNCDYLKNP